MKRSQRLRQIAEMAGSGEQDAGRDLAAARRQRDGERRQLEQLQEFLGEYRRRFETAAATGIGAGQLGNFRAFLTNLETSVGQQQAAVVSGDARVASAYQRWLAAYQRVQALEKVAANQAVTEVRDQARREQAQQDDRAGRSMPAQPRSG